jgi:hypothetical protein
MRRLVACLLVSNLLSGPALAAQSTDQSKRSTAPQPTVSPEKLRDIEERVAIWLKTCLTDWDAQTHMTKAEWRTTCHRVAAERRHFMISTPEFMSIGTVQRQR